MSLNDWIIEELKKADFSTAITSDLYKQALPLFGLNSTQESFSRHVRRVRQRYFESNPQEAIDSDFVDTSEKTSEKPYGNTSEKTEFEEKGNEGILTVNTSKEVKNLDELVRDCNIDLNVWAVEKSSVNRWETLTKTEDGYAKTPIYQVKAFLKKIQPTEAKFPVIAPVIINVPKPERTPLPTYSDVIERTLVISDGQVGYERDIDSGKLTTFHDRKSIDVVFKILKDTYFDTIILNGDWLDAPSASTFAQKPEFSFTLQPAINELAYIVANLRSLAPKSKIVYVQGNHENRIEKRIIENLNFAYNLKVAGETTPIYSLRNLLNLDKHNIEFIGEYPSGQYWVNDELVVKHGEFTNLSKELQLTTVSVIMGHLHRPETISKTLHTRNGKKTVTVSCTPALCQNTGVVPGMTARPIWSTGFTYVETNKINNQSNIHHVMTEDGVCIFNGKVYHGEDYNFSS